MTNFCKIYLALLILHLLVTIIIVVVVIIIIVIIITILVPILVVVLFAFGEAVLEPVVVLEELQRVHGDVEILLFKRRFDGLHMRGVSSVNQCPWLRGF